ncbi:MAG: hypothetical protein O7F16_03165 [Acidobacteria bacterium]|nr:hypothetical protein [Acidobacteriota bacterium]
MPPTDEIYYIDADLTTAPPTGTEKYQTPRPGSRQGRSRLGDATVVPTGGKRPALAASLSLFLCGAGQLLNGRRDLALLYFLTEVLFIAANWFLWNMWSSVVKTVGLFSIRPTDVMLVATAGNFLFLMFMVFNVFQAHKDASGGGQAESCQPWISTPASILVPGWGQILNGERGKGALLLGTFLAALYAFGLSWLHKPLWKLWDSSYQMIFGFELTIGGLIALSVALVAYIYAFYDALLVSRRQRTGGL